MSFRETFGAIACKSQTMHFLYQVRLIAYDIMLRCWALAIGKLSVLPITHYLLPAYATV
jgi:hypothetical protein